MACIGGHLRVVKYLIPKFGDNKFDMDNAAENCLHDAVREGHVRLATYLITKCGFDPNLRNTVCVRACICVSMCLCVHTCVCCLILLYTRNEVFIWELLPLLYTFLYEFNVSLCHDKFLGILGCCQ